MPNKRKGRQERALSKLECDYQATFSKYAHTEHSEHWKPWFRRVEREIATLRKALGIQVVS